ncbi:hypothetical protein [Saccharopolyspora terrae]|nr:hypothetical protein [Saccharopolyspora terrae]
MAGLAFLVLFLIAAAAVHVSLRLDGDSATVPIESDDRDRAASVER